MIHLYILTYNNNKILNEWALKSLRESDETHSTQR